MSSIFCQRCGAFDASLRYSSHPVVISMLVVANESSREGLFCGDCRARTSAGAIATSLIAGWWSPRGIFATIEAIGTNLRGGKIQATASAQMLREIARVKHAVNDFKTAAAFARAAEAAQPQQENKKLLQELVRAGFKGEVPPPSSRFVPYVPLIVFPVVLVAAAMFLMRDKPVDVVPVERASFTKPQPEPEPPPPQTPRKQLTMADMAVVNTGMGKAYRLDEGGWQKRADEMQKKLEPTSSIAQAQMYFEVRLAAIRSEVHRRVKKGEQIASVINEVEMLGSHPAVSPLLQQPDVRKAWDQLGEVLRASSGRSDNEVYDAIAIAIDDCIIASQ